MADLPSGVSQRDVADLLGLSVSTVSRALSDNDRVSDLTKRAVRDAARTLAASRTAVSRDTAVTPARPMIGLINSGLSNDRSPQSLDVNFAEVLSGVEQACARAGHIPYPWQESWRLLTDEGNGFFSHVTGIITVGGVISPEVIDTVQRQGLPVVIVGAQYPGSGITSVGSDNTTGTLLAVRHLVAQGHSKIALINGPGATHTSHEKLAGYLLGLAEAGIPLQPELIRSRDGELSFDETAGDAMATQVLGLPEPPTAIICAFDQFVTGVYRAASRMGIAIPGDLSVVGFHDDDAARFAIPPVTTIHVRRTQWGETAVDLLLRLREPSAIRGTHTLIPVHLVERESTGPPRASPDGYRQQ
ncbi:MAG: hypothetical protein AVDCRST_MAG33-2405 [uncultured Thermomicrobiales bacterium]|uniref:HTH lacI-type domain-containing protein n=1 Tax=uncultured Thermomicrobiales bacterium TaxID=1645740 RepID=A0A6J4V635_9BACT|nr:MAG: hypothetical protein AVDCRST_MAG33-2405 [uncultured Thermomicrobiales bacterium]